MKLKIKIVGLIILFFFLLLNQASAAKVFFEAPFQNIKTGNIFEINFMLDTQGQDINAVEGKINIPKDLVFREIKDGNSVVNLWVERPNYNNNEISFSGIIPGGYQSDKGYIFSLVLMTKNEGENLLSVNDIKVLANDGRGTSVNTAVENFNVSVINSLVATSSKEDNNYSNDKTLPEKFEPKIVRDSSLYDNKYFLVFSTQDKGVGIDHYEVREERSFNFYGLKLNLASTSWDIAESPYVLKDQNLESEIYVKALDKKGNERIVGLHATNTPRLITNPWSWAIIVLLLTFLFFRVYFLVRKHEKQP